MSKEKQLEKMATDIYSLLRSDTMSRAMASLLYEKGWYKQSEGKWIVTERGCVIRCSECEERLELCYPDGTEIRTLPYCPHCGVKMNMEE